jgi:hypothetical protein
VKRSLDLLDEPGDQGKPRSEIAGIAGCYPEGLRPGGGAPARQAAAQRLVDDLAKRPAGAARFRLELGRCIVIPGERRSHLSMLWHRQHEVEPEALHGV